MKKIGVLFPGYGSQFVGMGKELYDQSRLMQEHFDEASSCLDINFVKLCFASSDTQLSEVAQAYVSLFLVSSALYDIMSQSGLNPTMVAGHGIGEYAALFAARSINLPDGLYVINKYAKAYETFVEEHDVRVVKVTGIDQQEVKQIVGQCSNEKQRADIAIVNTDDQLYVSGIPKAISCVEDNVHAHKGSFVKVVDAGHGVHSPLAQAVQDQVASYFEKIDCKDLAIPLITCIDGTQIKTGQTAKLNLIRQITAPIMWQEVLPNFADMDALVLIGPGTQLVEGVRAIYPDKKIYTINTPADIEQAINELVEVNNEDGQGTN